MKEERQSLPTRTESGSWCVAEASGRVGGFLVSITFSERRERHKGVHPTDSLFIKQINFWIRIIFPFGLRFGLPSAPRKLASLPKAEGQTRLC